MTALIFFLLGALFLAACEWFYLKKFRGNDPFDTDSDSPSSAEKTLSEKASSFTATTTSVASNTTSKILDTPAVSKGREFLERIAAKESNEQASSESSVDEKHTENSGKPEKQDKSSIKTTRAMSKKVSRTTTKTEPPKSSPAVTKTASSDSGAEDKLQKVSGIGPKIEQLLQQEGVVTFDDLAKTKISKLSDIMQKAGPRYALADVSSWPEQAKMLADGDVEALQMLQQSLKKS